MKKTVNISLEKLNELRNSLQSAIDFIDGLQKKRVPKISKAERRKLDVQKIMQNL